jgi:glycosyltransferase involved in cell wall biosynthesis
VTLVLAQSSGGIGRHVRTLAAAMHARDIGISICAPAESIARLGLDRLDADVVAAPLGATGPRAIHVARRQLRQVTRGADVVHAHGLRAGAECAAFGPARPLVVTWHNAPPGGRLGQLGHRVLSRYVARSADLTLAASEDLAAAARAAGARAVRTTFVTAPALPGPTRDPRELRAELGAGDRPVVLAVGRLHQQKRFDVLVDAASDWPPGTDAPLVLIAGDGPERDALRARIAASGAPVRLLGPREDVADLLAVADVVALPSAWEARSLVAQEALRTGVPLVTTAVGGMPSLVGSAAELVPVGDAAALRSAVAGILADGRRRQELIAGGLARAAGWPSETSILDILEQAYLDLSNRVRS